MGATAAMIFKWRTTMTSFANVLKVSALVASLAAVPALADDIAPTYTHEVLTRVADHAVYPRVAMVNSEEGVVTVAVAVDAQGNLTGVNVLNSSGIPSIDLAAIQAAKDAAPYPAPAVANTVVTGKIRFSM
jgi:TonB family protein